MDRDGTDYLGEQKRGRAAPGRGRSKTVSFRANGEDFELLTRACRSVGSPSLSAFARAAVLDKVETVQLPRLSLSTDLNTFSRTLAHLDAILVEASKEIRRLLGPAVSETDADESETP